LRRETARRRQPLTRMKLLGDDRAARRPSPTR
jgi:hypothetical protein